MEAQRIDGKFIAQAEREKLIPRIKELTLQGNQPGLSVILVGEDPASMVYVGSKEKTAKALGIQGQVYRLAKDTSLEVLLELIEQLNNDASVHGILVQMPLPAHLDENKVIKAILPEKDVDGFHPLNAGALLAGQPCTLPCTPRGIMKLIKSTGIDLCGKHAVVIGRSAIVGKPVAMLLLQEHATVTICHSRTPDLSQFTRQADVLVSAVGRPNLVQKHMVKPGAIVIDVGINRTPDGKLCGDVDYDQVKEVAGYITPVPGGVGPMTIAMLMRNTVDAAARACGLDV